jgi:hypothetical protein
MAQLTFVTVTFPGELALLRLQAVSMARFLDPALCEAIILVLNDAEEADADGTFEALLRSELLPLFGPLEGRVRLLRAGALTAFPTRSYWRQQVVKLAIAAEIQASHFICLDTKNIFIRPVAEADYFRDGRPCGYFQPLYAGIQSHSSDCYSDVFGLPRLPLNAPVMAIMTPFVIETEAAIAAMRALEERVGSPFDEAFCALPAKSEFMLYFTYLRGAVPDAPGRYFACRSLSRTFWDNSGRREGEFLALLEGARRDGVPSIGLHRRRLDLMTPEEEEALVGFLASLGLPPLRWRGAPQAG